MESKYSQWKRFPLMNGKLTSQIKDIGSSKEKCLNRGQKAVLERRCIPICTTPCTCSLDQRQMLVWFYIKLWHDSYYFVFLKLQFHILLVFAAFAVMQPKREHDLSLKILSSIHIAPADVKRMVMILLRKENYNPHLPKEVF